MFFVLINRVNTRSMNETDNTHLHRAWRIIHGGKLKMTNDQSGQMLVECQTADQQTELEQAITDWMMSQIPGTLAHMLHGYTMATDAELAS